ncbi:hypothetical protein A3Q56_06927 [Intoshia linei]|uniref:ATP-dependent (S)-NAD(P)H-hydrate dehydratase n=1 Tax=Intoshia linei TaxID=1819745 RepID=A0A177AUZ3_9BILA|nr:hypothetical protein A3Q56_06927 [Intoshia linei]
MNYIELFYKIIPKLSNGLYKGNCGKTAIIGGCLEYSGAPYFASIASLRAGADLSYIITDPCVSTCIKSYSPDIIVLPYLNSNNGFVKSEQFYKRFDIFGLGPGLGKSYFSQIDVLIEQIIKRKISIVIDADGINYICEYNEKFRNYLKNNPETIIIITPNLNEFNKLKDCVNMKHQDNAGGINELCKLLGKNVYIVLKGKCDTIGYSQDTDYMCIEPIKSINRRCGGQGDVLCGIMATFVNWAIKYCQKNNISNMPKYIKSSIIASSQLVRYSANIAFIKKKRSIITNDIINEIGSSFEFLFENKI